MYIFKRNLQKCVDIIRKMSIIVHVVINHENNRKKVARMTIAQLFIACSNLHLTTQFRVYSQGETSHELIFREMYLYMPYEVKSRMIDCFEFDNDLGGVLVIVE